MKKKLIYALLLVCLLVGVGSVLIEIMFSDTLKLNINQYDSKNLKYFYNFYQLDSGKRLPLSGSEQFTQSSLAGLIKKIENLKGPNPKIIFLDAREESHGFLNGHSISWKLEHNDANVGKSLDQIRQEENSLLTKLASQYVIWTVKQSLPLLLRVKTVSSEESLIKNFYPNSTYVRLPITDHSYPSDYEVDQFVSLVNHQQDDEWMHVHCFAGRGRTGSLMAMYDMQKNAKSMSFQNIMERSDQIGLDLAPDSLKANPQKKKKKQNSSSSVEKEGGDPEANKLKRWEFLNKFYTYCQTADTTQIAWTQWLKSHP